MSTANNLEQQRKLAKNLLKAARDGDGIAIARLQKHDATKFKLSDAQRAIARETGFESWPKLVASIKESEIQTFKKAIRSADAAVVRQLLAGSLQLQKHVNAPIFDFGRRAVHVAANRPSVIDVLLEFKADINLRSDWEKGPFSALDECTDENARQLIARGATLTPHAAARLGWISELRQIVEANTQVVHEKGGDGQRPLHFAKTIEIADFLLDHGADIDARCVDHHSTAAQYALTDRPEITKHLLGRGAMPDIFMPAFLGDVSLAQKVIAENPACLAARTNCMGYDRVPVFAIYNWLLGFYVSPHEVALRFGHRDVFDLLWKRSSPRIRFLTAAMRHDESAARAVLLGEPSLVKTLTDDEHALLAHST